MGRNLLTSAAITLTLMFAASVVFLFFFDKPGSDGGRHMWGKAQTEMGEIQKALNTRAMNGEKYPADLDDLERDAFKNGVPHNPFTKQNYDYITDGEQFVLVCYGRDGEPGGEDPPDLDIVYTGQGRLASGR